MSPIYWVGSPKFTAGHPAPLIALVHHRMVGTAPDQVGAILAVTAVVLGLITRSRVSPA